MYKYYIYYFTILCSYAEATCIHDDIDIKKKIDLGIVGTYSRFTLNKKKKGYLRNIKGDGSIGIKTLYGFLNHRRFYRILNFFIIKIKSFKIYVPIKRFCFIFLKTLNDFFKTYKFYIELNNQ